MEKYNKRKEQRKIIKDINLFLSFFEMYLPAKDTEDLINDLFYYKGISIMDAYSNVVGNIVKEEENIIFSAINKNNNFECTLSIKDSGKVKFEKYRFSVINSENIKLKGSIEFSRKNDEKNIFMKGIYEIYENSTQISRASFSTVQSKINLTNSITKEYFNYKHEKKEAVFLHKKEDINLNVISDFNFVYYKVKQLLEKVEFEDSESYVENRYSYNGYELSKDFVHNLIESDINKIIQEYDPEYFNFITEQKEILNQFAQGMFERIFIQALLKLNKDQIKNILDVNITPRGYVYKR